MQDSDNVPSVDTVKILGIHFDKFMTWSEHIRHAHNQISKNLLLLKLIKTYLQLDSRKLFYNSYLLPYASIIVMLSGEIVLYPS